MSLYRSLPADQVDRVMNRIYQALREPPRPVSEIELFGELPVSGRKGVLRSLWELMREPPSSRERSPGQPPKMRINVAPPPQGPDRSGFPGSMIVVWMLVMGIQGLARVFDQGGVAPPTLPSSSYRVTQERAAGAPPSGSAEAAKTLAKPANRNSSAAVAQFNLGVQNLHAGDTPGAIKAFEKAVELDPTMSEAYFQMGTLMVDQDRAPEAAPHLEKYLALNPSNPRHVATARAVLAALKKSEKSAAVR